MPLIYLLLLRTMRVLEYGRNVPLHVKELMDIVHSFYTIWGAIDDLVKNINGTLRNTPCVSHL